MKTFAPLAAETLLVNSTCDGFGPRCYRQTAAITRSFACGAADRNRRTELVGVMLHASLLQQRLKASLRFAHSVLAAEPMIAAITKVSRRVPVAAGQPWRYSGQGTAACLHCLQQRLSRVCSRCYRRSRQTAAITRFSSDVGSSFETFALLVAETLLVDFLASLATPALSVTYIQRQ